MTFGNRESQLELFDVTRQTAPRPSLSQATGRVFLHLRYDQLILRGIAGLIGLTIIFASGVERGKQLVRSERVLLARQEPQASAPSARTSGTGTEPSPKSSTELKSSSSEQPQATPAPTAGPVKVKTPKRVVEVPAEQPAQREMVKASAGSGNSRYAVQVSTFSRPQLAKQEMDRLRARGERAFLVMRDGRTMVYVGPFPSKMNASEKVANLRGRYQDCFVRTL